MLLPSIYGLIGKSAEDGVVFARTVMPQDVLRILLTIDR